MSKYEHDEIVARFRREESTFEKPWFNSCSEVLTRNNLKGLKCLDLCCGNGEYSQILRDTFSMDVTCADYIPSHLKHAQQLGFETITVNLDDDSALVKDIAQKYCGEFDLVVNLAAIEHVYNSDNLLQFAHTVLKPSGKLLLNTPNIGFLAYRIFSALSGNRPFGEGHHIRFWDYRFLRTNLFLNGFEVRKDCRSFQSLPEDVLTRGFRNCKLFAKLVATSFTLCRFLQHVPLLKGLTSDELTILCQKEDVEPVGFDYLILKNKIENNLADDSSVHALERLWEAQKRGWLKEHLYMTRLVEDNVDRLAKRVHSNQ